MRHPLKSLCMILLLVFAAFPVYAISAPEEADSNFGKGVEYIVPEEVDPLDDVKRAEPQTFWLKQGQSKKVGRNIYLTYVGSSQAPTQYFCTEEAKTCADGSTVSRNPNRDCNFDACPDATDSSVSDVLAEGAEKTYALQGDMAYAVEVMIIEDTEPATATFNINGEVTDQLSPGKSVLLKNGVTLLVRNIALRTASGDDLVKFTLSVDALSDAAVGDVVADKGVCESFTMTYEYVSSKGKSSDVGSQSFSDASVAGDIPDATVEDKAIGLISQADAFVFKVKAEVGYQGRLDEADILDIKEEKAELQEELEKGDAREIMKQMEKLDKELSKAMKRFADTDKSDKYAAERAEDYERVTEKESKTFCLVPGEVGYPIILYEKKDDAVLVGYNVWKDDDFSSDAYIAMPDDINALQKKQRVKKSGTCAVDGEQVPVGTRLNVEGVSQYCDPLTKMMLDQRPDDEAAENNYECLSNEARNGQCVNTLSFLERIWNAVVGIFGF